MNTGKTQGYVLTSDERLGAHTGDSAEQVMQLHYFSIAKVQPSGDMTFAITVKEFAVPPAGQQLRFYAEAEKAVNQKTAPLVPCGQGHQYFRHSEIPYG